MATINQPTMLACHISSIMSHKAFENQAIGSQEISPHGLKLATPRTWISMYNAAVSKPHGEIHIKVQAICWYLEY